MSCFGNTNVNETFIIEPAGESLSACTGFYTNIIGSCTGNTQILLGTNTIKFIGQLSGDSIIINSISATTYQNLPIDIRVTGGTYSNGTATFKNNTGGTFTVSGFTVTSGGGTFTGGTVTGATNFTGGVTANTISATTYLNLPVTADTFVTGFTLSNNTITLTQNRTDKYSAFTISLSAYTGSSSTSGAYLPLSGGTVSGRTIFTSGLTANTISATTYQNLPIDIRVTGATYSNNTFLFTNNTGGTYSVLFNTVTGLTATTLSAITYLGLPTDIRVTGGTYSAAASTLIFTNNTGGTFNVSGITTSTQFTGGTVSGNTIFTSGLSANTISATTYQNLPLDIRTTGATYSNNTFTHTNNTGGTYSVLFNTMTGLTVTTISATTYLGLPVNPFVYSYSVWVSPNGDDSTGVLGRIDLPFSTVRGAIEEVKSKGGANYTIFVMPGSYNETSWSFNSSIENTTIKFCGNVRIVFNNIVGYSSSIVVDDTTVSFIGDDRTVSSSVNVFNNVSISNNINFDSNIFEIFGSSFVNMSNLSIMPYNNNSSYSNSDIIIYEAFGNSPKININNCTLISESDYNITSRYSKFNGSVSINNSYISSVALKYVNQFNFSNISIKIDGGPDSCGYWQITNTNFRMSPGIMLDNHNTHIYMNTISEGVWGRLSGCIFYGTNNEYFIWRNVVSGYLDIVGTIYSTCGIHFENVNVNFGTAEVGVAAMLDPENFYR
jgi:hypothetical protein